MSTPPKTLLVLDDSEFFSAFLEPILEASGYAVTTRPELAGALLIDPTWHSDSGYLLLAALRELAPRTTLPVVVLLASTSSQSRAFLQGLQFPWTVKGRLKAESLGRYVGRHLGQQAWAGEFGRLVEEALAKSLQVDSRPFLHPLISGSLLHAISEADHLARALELGVQSLLDHFPLLAAGLEVNGSRLLACCANPEARRAATAVRETLGWSPEPSEPELRELSADFPGWRATGGQATGGQFERSFTLPRCGGRLVAVFGTDDDLILDYFGRALDDFDRALTVLTQGLALANSERRVFRVFSRFVPSVVIEDLLRKRSAAALLTGEKRRIVALFSHVRDFSFYVEENDPKELVRFLNRHFSLYAKVIRKHGGFINKYIGDAVFAIFGAPVSHIDNARRALAAALEIQQELAQLPLLDLHYPPSGYRVGLGLNEGESIVGNIGSRDSFDYTAIGDTINLAARLESLCKHYQVELLLSQDFRQALESQEDPHPLRQVDRARVKGKLVPTVFHTVYPAEFDLEFDRCYRKGLTMFRLGNWTTALEFFEKGLELDPSDFLCGLYSQRCREFLKAPPVSWDGAITLGFK
ncbi:MAG: adenylate/guanylate cyclase domain-containing protein [Spirochaetales bacterium]